MEYLMREASKKIKLHPNTMRSLERKGIVCPSRSLAGHRIYTDFDLQQITDHYKRITANWIVRWGLK